MSLIFRYIIYFIHQQVVYKASKIEIEKRKRNKGLADSCITVTIVIDFDRRNKWITRLSAHLVTGITTGSKNLQTSISLFYNFSVLIFLSIMISEANKSVYIKVCVAPSEGTSPYYDGTVAKRKKHSWIISSDHI